MTATPTKVIRHPRRLPTTAPSGTPIAIATVSPAFTIAMARPRRSGGTRAPASAFAFGVYMPAAHASSTRAAARPQKVCVLAATTLASEKIVIAARSSFRRSTLPVSVVKIGELSAYASAKMLMSDPASATDTARSAAMLGRIAAIMNPSVPMANVPSANQ